MTGLVLHILCTNLTLLAKLQRSAFFYFFSFFSSLSHILSPLPFVFSKTFIVIQLLVDLTSLLHWSAGPRGWTQARVGGAQMSVWSTFSHKKHWIEMVVILFLCCAQPIRFLPTNSWSFEYKEMKQNFRSLLPPYRDGSYTVYRRRRRRSFDVRDSLCRLMISSQTNKSRLQNSVVLAFSNKKLRFSNFVLVEHQGLRLSLAVRMLFRWL